MTAAKREPRAITIAEIAATFQLASYWWLDTWCPAVHRKETGGYGVRVLGCGLCRRCRPQVSYSYFEVDADGTIVTAPRGWAKEFKPGRIVDIEVEAERAATPDPDADRITFGGVS